MVSAIPWLALRNTLKYTALPPLKAELLRVEFHQIILERKTGEECLGSLLLKKSVVQQKDLLICVVTWEKNYTLLRSGTLGLQWDSRVLTNFS